MSSTTKTVKATKTKAPSSKKQSKNETSNNTDTPVDVDVPATESTEEQNVKGGNGKNVAKRTFTVLQVSRDGKEEEFKGGRYQSKTPAGAARKAATQACKMLYGKEEHCSIDIHIKEVTKNHPTKEYGYRAIRTKDTKDVPFAASTGKVSIPFEFSMNLRSLKKDKADNVENETVTTA